jgi:hypothetical protein
MPQTPRSPVQARSPPAQHRNGSLTSHRASDWGSAPSAFEAWGAN